MQVPIFTRWWEIAIFLLGGLLLSPFLLLLYLWEGLCRKQEQNAKRKETV
tara:strand:- start:106 stop:255 length:150 start_codon:yes stop_codon:yes gene_type:complete